MKFWRTIFLISVGGFVGSGFGYSSTPAWMTVLVVAAGGWAWMAYGSQVSEAVKRRLYTALGRPAPVPETDPAALAAEIAVLNRQVAALRDTATSFDVGFGETLQRLDERLARMEQQSAYVQPQTSKPGV